MPVHPETKSGVPCGKRSIVKRAVKVVRRGIIGTPFKRVVRDESVLDPRERRDAETQTQPDEEFSGAFHGPILRPRPSGAILLSPLSERA
jgi:hypothetical protein